MSSIAWVIQSLCSYRELKVVVALPFGNLYPLSSATKKEIDSLVANFINPHATLLNLQTQGKICCRVKVFIS